MNKGTISRLNGDSRLSIEDRLDILQLQSDYEALQKENEKLKEALTMVTNSRDLNRELYQTRKDDYEKLKDAFVNLVEMIHMTTTHESDFKSSWYLSAGLSTSKEEGE